MWQEVNLNLEQETEVQELHLVMTGREGYYIAKRLMDIVGAACLLLVLSPLMLLIAAAIYIYSPGPIFYVQERVGAKRLRMGNQIFWKREPFRFFKFRTMKINADSSIHEKYVTALIKNDQKSMAEVQGENTKVRKLLHDPRLIRPGSLLRKFSLDELPQLWNVLIGDMSLVGPRPPIPYEVKVYKPWHYRRFGAQAGISGLQQVKARCSADFDAQIKIDLEYIANQSLWLDIKIALLTPLAILSSRGAH
jgi:lipopolysaccharide/colanic/teichoic acid biosynthesis glycosyltransferase